MKDKNKILGTVAMHSDGVTLVISGAGAYDHCLMRAAQLSALTNILSGDGFVTFELYSDTVKDNVMWLVSSLACELEAMLPIVRKEALATRKGAHDD